MKKCLIVDDSKIVRKVMRQIIDPIGFEILEAGNGQEALDQLAQHPVDLVMLDWNMPVMNGIDCLRKMRANTSIKQPAVIFCTTENEFSKISEALSAGANEYVMKPFDEAIIRSKLEQLGLL
jgi:two-component system chemotaxis response regulator CheY